MSTREDYGTAYVCVDCYVAHHHGYREIDREPTDDELHAWHGGYLRGHDLPNMIASEHAENDSGLVVREWFAGEDSDRPTDREPLARLADLELADNTCSDHTVEDLYDDDDGDRTGETSACEHCGQTGYETGTEDFSWRACEGCGSTLGGARYRLSLWKVAP